jgi:hypothetical protein
MSQWTHVTGAIRFASFGRGRPVTEPDMSHMLPSGSEGYLTVSYTDVYRTDTQAFVTASISGDLRDFGDAQEILSWLNFHTEKAMMIYGGIVEIAVERENTYIYQCNKGTRLWELILTQPIVNAE